MLNKLEKLDVEKLISYYWGRSDWNHEKDQSI